MEQRLKWIDGLKIPLNTILNSLDMELAKIGELIKNRKPLEVLELIKNEAPKEVVEASQKMFEDFSVIESIDGQWRDILALVYYSHFSYLTSQMDDNQALASCVVSSLNASKISLGMGLEYLAPTFLRNAAKALTMMKMTSQAERSYREAERICRVKIEEVSEKEKEDWLKELGAVLNDLGVLCYELEKFKDADRYITEALEIRRKVAEPLELAETLANAGAIYIATKKFYEAEELFKESEAIFRELVEKDELVKFDLAIALSNFGRLYRKLAKFEKAEKLYLESLNLFKELAEENEDFEQFVATTLKYLGDVNKDLKKYDKAKDYYLESKRVFAEIQRRTEERRLKRSS